MLDQENRKKALAWLEAVSTQALTEAQQGNTGLLNTITAKNPAIAYYINNVATRKVMSAEQYANQYPQYLEQVDQARREYEALESIDNHDERLNNIEAGLAELKTLLTEAIAAKETTSAKPKRGRKAKVTEADSDPEEDAENDDEPASEETDINEVEDDEEAD